ncbi:MAG: EAL domain-containing protein, partial [Rhodothalassiaceae bacterium]
QKDEIVGIEALVRWNHPDLGLISPESFIGIAEEAGITAELGRWVVSRALAEVVNLERHGLPPLRLSINISADMFANMGGRGLPGILEVTERSILALAPQTLRAIEHLREHGLRFALDDFGTGYSALSSLKTLPVDEIKIDRSFILGAGIEDVAVLRAIIAMAKTLDLTVIAEGVETPDQLRILRAEGCDLYQGYLCAPALPGPQLLDMLKDRNVTPA